MEAPQQCRRTRWWPPNRRYSWPRNAPPEGAGDLRRASRRAAGPRGSATRASRPSPTGPHASDGRAINHLQGTEDLQALADRKVFRNTCAEQRKFPKRHTALRGGPRTRKKATVILCCEEESLPPLRIVGHVPARGKEMWHGHCQLP